MQLGTGLKKPSFLSKCNFSSSLHIFVYEKTNIFYIFLSLPKLVSNNRHHLYIIGKSFKRSFNKYAKFKTK